MAKIFGKSAITTVAAMGLLAPSSYAYHHGFFLGLGLGSVSQDNDVTITYTPATGATTDKPNLNRQNWQMDIFGGYAATINRFYMAGVVNYMFPSITASANFVTAGPPLAYTYNYRVGSSGGSWGLAVRLGYEFWSNFVAYLRFGMERRSFKMFFNPGDAVASIDAEGKKWGFTPGIGAEYQFFKNTFVGLEYRRAMYSRLTKTAVNATNGNVAFNLRPNVDTIMMTLRYQFCM